MEKRRTMGASTFHHPESPPNHFEKLTSTPHILFTHHLQSSSLPGVEVKHVFLNNQENDPWFQNIS